MASILTNTSAMTALQTLRRVSGNLENTQDRISTGLKVNSAKDNAAYWSIATTMKSDVAGFKAVSESLGLSAATTVVAGNAADSVVDMLKEMKQRIVTGQSKGTDPKFIQDELNQYMQQIEGVIASASFNGDNMLKVSYSSDGSAKDKDVDVLASLSRTTDGVTPNYISFSRQDMRSDSIVGRATIEQQIDSTEDEKASIEIKLGAAGETFIDGQNLGLKSFDLTFTSESGTKTNVSVNLSTEIFDTDTATTRANLVTTLNTRFDADLGAGTLVASFSGDKLVLTVADSNTDGNYTSKIEGVWVNTVESDAFGGLADLKQIDIANNAKRSLEAIDTLISAAIDKAAVLGSIENRIKIQTSFVSKLSDALNKGIGTLVDADMNEESSRLQALQVQQQLATQALSIANQQPQNILSLFR